MPTPACPGRADPDLGSLFVHYAPMVRRALARLGVADAALDDAVQDVFVVLVRRVDAFDRERSLTNWLWGIARGVASTHRRSRRRRDRLHAALPSSTASGEDSVAERAVATGQARAILDDFLGTLDDDKCAVFVLAEVEGCTGPEIARRLDVNLNTVYARLRAARRRFDTAVARHRPGWARALLATWWPAAFGSGAPVWIPATASSAMAAALVLPVALPEALPTPKLEWTAPIEATAVAENDAAPGRRLRTRRTSVSEVDEEIVILEEDDASQIEADLAKEGDETALTAAQENPTMRIPAAATLVAVTLASSTAFAKPTRAGDAWRADDPDDADGAAFVDGDEVSREYVFDNDTVEGENLSPDGTILLQPPNVRFGSMLNIRPHFVPELIKLATDV